MKLSDDIDSGRQRLYMYREEVLKGDEDFEIVCDYILFVLLSLCLLAVLFYFAARVCGVRFFSC